MEGRMEGGGGSHSREQKEAFSRRDETVNTVRTKHGVCPDGQGGRLHNREGVSLLCPSIRSLPRYVHKGWRYGLRNLVQWR